MKISIRQLKRLIREQVEECSSTMNSLEEMGATAGFAEMDQLELDNSNPEELEEFEQELKHADWYYMMSDDDRIYRSGSRQLAKLKLKADKLGTAGTELFNEYADKYMVNPKLDIKPWKEIAEASSFGPPPIHEDGNVNTCASNPATRLDTLEEETEEGCHEGYTGSPADGGGITGTQTTSGAADVIKEAFNRRAYQLLESLKKEFE